MRVRKRIVILITGVMLTAMLSGGCGAAMNAAVKIGNKKKTESGFQDKYVPSEYVQADIDSDTVQWFCSAYAIYTKLNKKDLKMIGGTAPENKEMHEWAIKEALDSGWGITSHKSAVEQINWILSGGHRKKYRERLAEMKKEGILSMSEEEMEAAVYETKKDDTEKYVCSYHAYREFGENALDGWDYCRALQVLGDCYQADYISLEECLDESLIIAKRLQKTFANWEDVCKSYLYGHYYWGHDSVDTEWRWGIYQELSGMADGPYTVPYDTELKESWKGVKGSGGLEKKEEQNGGQDNAGQEEETSDDMSAAEPEIDEEGRYILLSSDGERKAAVRLPENYEYSKDRSDANTVVFENMPDESEDVVSYESLCFYMHKLTDYYTEDLVEAIAKDNAERREAGDVYSNVQYTDTQETKAGDYTVKYNSTSGEIGTGSKVCDKEWSAWIRTEDDYLIYCLAFESTNRLDDSAVSEEKVKEIMSLVRYIL